MLQRVDGGKKHGEDDANNRLFDDEMASVSTAAIDATVTDTCEM